MSELEKEAYELYRTIWSKKLAKEEPQRKTVPDTSLVLCCRYRKIVPSQRHITKAG